MTNKSKTSALAAMTAVVAMLLMGCSSNTPEAALTNETVEEVESSTPAAEEEVAQPEAPSPAEAAAPPETSTVGYQEIYDEYSARLTAECPSLSLTECAELSNEGVTKMAEYMFKAKGTEGQMATYEEWAGKLMEVYMASAQ